MASHKIKSRCVTSRPSIICLAPLSNPLSNHIYLHILCSNKQIYSLPLDIFIHKVLVQECSFLSVLEILPILEGQEEVSRSPALLPFIPSTTLQPSPYRLRDVCLTYSARLQAPGRLNHWLISLSLSVSLPSMVSYYAQFLGY